MFGTNIKASEIPYMRFLWLIWLLIVPFISIPLFIVSVLVLAACASCGLFED